MGVIELTKPRPSADKNQHRIDEAEQQFKEIQQAYEILSSPEERKWYSVVPVESLFEFGSLHNLSSACRCVVISRGWGEFIVTSYQPTRPDDEVDLGPYFEPGAFKGYKNTPKGFYNVFGEVFAALFQQEIEVSPDVPEAPDLGGPTATAKQVNDFYSFWINFTSVKEFAWADEYNPASAPTRKIRRLMEEENKKRRRKEKGAFVDLVRQLAAHVRSKDTRFAKYQAEAEEAAKVAAAEAEKLRKQQREERLAKAMGMEEADWTDQLMCSKRTAEGLRPLDQLMRNMRTAEGLRPLESEVGGHGDGDSVGGRVKAADLERSKMFAEEEVEEEEAEAQPYCVVCRKRFKSESQWRNHEKSKKHLEKVAELKSELEAEELMATAEDGGHAATPAATPAASEEVPEVQEPLRRGKAAEIDESEAHGEEEEEDEDAMLARMMRAQQVSSRTPMPVEEEEEEEDDDDDDDGAAEDEDAMLAGLVSQMKKQGKVAPAEEDDEDDEEEDEDEDDEMDDEDAMLANMASQQRKGREPSIEPEDSAESDTEEGNDEDDEDAFLASTAAPKPRVGAQGEAAEPDTMEEAAPGLHSAPEAVARSSEESQSPPAPPPRSHQQESGSTVADAASSGSVIHDDVPPATDYRVG
eukprot:gene7212-8594_t